jgi:putative membrane protein
VVWGRRGPAEDATVGQRVRNLLLAWVVLAVAVMNMVLGPILKLLPLPVPVMVMVATLGLFALVINTGLFLLTSWLMGSVKVDTFWAALLGAAVISIVWALLTFLVDRYTTRRLSAAPRPA